MRYRFCPRCGSELTLKQTGDEGMIPWCLSCQRPWFDSFATCVLSVVVNEEDEICLIRQSYGDTERFVGVAGYMKPGETAEGAAAREVAEEIGASALEVEYLESHFYEGRDQLMLGFMVRVQKNVLKLSGELCDARWFPPAEAETTVRQGSIIQKLIIAAEKRLGK